MGNENFDFEVRPCMLDTEDKCVDFGEICCSTIEERMAFNNYIDRHGLPKELKFKFDVNYYFGEIPF